MKKTPELEICCNNWLSAKTADEAGADRIEICSGLGEGGVSPSPGFILQCVHTLSLKTHVLIRPRSGDFLYNSEEIEIMKKDLQFCKDNGVDGVVFGFLLPNGSIDIELTKEFIELAHPMKTTFHRAFDMCKDPLKAMEDLISLEIDYLLTSGQQATAIKGGKLINQLVQKSKRKPIIMAAAGVRVSVLAELMEKTGAGAYHLSARTSTVSKMIYKKTSVSMGSDSVDAEYIIQSQDLDAIKKAKKTLLENKFFDR